MVYQPKTTIQKTSTVNSRNCHKKFHSWENPLSRVIFQQLLNGGTDVGVPVQTPPHVNAEEFVGVIPEIDTVISICNGLQFELEVGDLLKGSLSIHHVI